MPGATNNNKVEVTLIMRALEAEVFDADAVWEAVQPLLPPPDRSHPLGCHRPRISDRLCLRGLFIRLVTGSSWVDIEAILDHQVSDTTLRARRDEWIDAGVFDKLKDEALAAFDRIIELDLDDVAIDGSLHKAPIWRRRHRTEPHRSRRVRLEVVRRSRWTRHQIGWATDGANRNDLRLLQPTLDALEATGLHHDIAMLHLDRGYDYPKTRAELAARGYTDLDIQKRGTKPPPGSPHRLTLGLRWVVEATNSWWSNYGQLLSVEGQRHDPSIADGAGSRSRFRSMRCAPGRRVGNTAGVCCCLFALAEQGHPSRSDEAPC